MPSSTFAMAPLQLQTRMLEFLRRFTKRPAACLGSLDGGAPVPFDRWAVSAAGATLHFPARNATLQAVSGTMSGALH